MADYEKQAEAIIYKIELLPTKAEKLNAYKNELTYLYRKIEELNDFKNSQVAKLLKENESLKDQLEIAIDLLEKKNVKKE